jgi:hypothetical protein
MQVPLEALTRPFDGNQVRQRQGHNGKVLNYVETHSVICRLNEAFDGLWSFEVVEWKALESEVLVRGKLTAAGETKSQFGGAAITKGKETGSPISIPDDLKAAASDSLKKCATLFGVGLELYGQAAGDNGQGGQRPGESGGSSGPQAPATPNQVDFLRRLSRNHLLTEGERTELDLFLRNGPGKVETSRVIGRLKGALATRQNMAADADPETHVAPVCDDDLPL